jgi:hypothetical protein
MAKCPYCGGELLVDEPRLPRLTPRQYRIYQTLLNAGPNGMGNKDLAVRMLADEEWPTPGIMISLRVRIHELNKRIASMGQRVVSYKYGTYVLKHLEDEDAKAIEEDEAEANYDPDQEDSNEE